MDRSMTFAVIKRILISILIGLVSAWIVSEVSYQLNKDPAARDEANRVELVIPAGTAERIANGEPAVGIPERMSFVEGDLLIVRNEDSVSHQLGPIWVPPQSSGVLQIATASDYSYACTFSDTKVFGLEVHPQLTLEARIQGTLAMGLPSSVMIALYSFLVVPIKKKPELAEVRA
jgi:hypothetical protein